MLQQEPVRCAVKLVVCYTERRLTSRDRARVVVTSSGVIKTDGDGRRGEANARGSADLTAGERHVGLGS